MMRCTTLPALLLALSPALAQTSDLQFDLCVKQFSEFRDRFNGTYAGHVPEGAVGPDRRTLLRSLFAGTVGADVREALVEEVAARGTAGTLELDGAPWLAHVICRTKGQGDTARTGFWLVRERVGAARKWSVLSTDARGTGRATMPYIDSKGHEVGFTDLLRIDDEGGPGLDPYIGPPGIAGLFGLQEALLQGKLRILSVERVTMHLLQVPGWTLLVAYVPPSPDPSDLTPSGWNITRAERMGDRAKLDYIWKHVLGL